jgi:hypothetical protein
MNGLTGLLHDIASATSVKVALELASRCGGLQMSLSDAPDSALVRAVGMEAAQAIVKHVGRGVVTIPMANIRGQRARRARSAEMLAGGARPTDVAQACDVHVRTVWRVKAAIRDGEDLRLPLFDRDDD